MRTSVKRPPVFCLLTCIAAVATGPAKGMAQVQSEQPLVINVRDAEWGPPGNTPRFPQGVRTSQLGLDPDNDGPTYLASFDSNSSISGPIDQLMPRFTTFEV